MNLLLSTEGVLASPGCLCSVDSVTRSPLILSLFSFACAPYFHIVHHTRSRAIKHCTWCSVLSQSLYYSLKFQVHRQTKLRKWPVCHLKTYLRANELGRYIVGFLFRILELLFLFFSQRQAHFLMLFSVTPRKLWVTEHQDYLSVFGLYGAYSWEIRLELWRKQLQILGDLMASNVSLECIATEYQTPSISIIEVWSWGLHNRDSHS